jgi:UDP-2,3-diacylglucosamine pyrophosphatase LpxH
MEKNLLKVRTVILSDIHLGTRDSKAREVCHFLRSVRCEKIILNGDIIDGWRLANGSQWTNDHTRFIRVLLKKIEKQHTSVIYTRGNHDDVLAKIIPFTFSGITMVEDYVHETPNGRYFVLHGDVFDTITRNFAFISHLGDWGYHLLLAINRANNRWRAWRGKEYWSLSQAIKARVKTAVNHISKFEDHIAELAAEKSCMGVICGHIHTPADKHIGKTHYLNSGDWVESLTAIIEHYDGRFELISFVDFLKEYPMPLNPSEALNETIEA